MCIPYDPNILYYLQKSQPKGSKVQIHRLARRTRYEESTGKEMLIKNLKLYIENIRILEENEKLRKKASLLHQQNLELMSEIQKKLSSDLEIPKCD